MLLVPVAYEKYDKFVRLSRTLKEARVRSILTGTGFAFSLLIAYVVSFLFLWGVSDHEFVFLLPQFRCDDFGVDTARMQGCKPGS